MALNRVDLGIQYFPQFAADRAIANAQIYIGQPNLDPAVLANQIQAYVVQENGTQVAVPQPIRTGAGGVPTYNGSPVQVAVDALDYSVKVLTSTGSQIYYVPSVSAIASFATNASAVVYDPAGTGAVPTSLELWLRNIVLITDYGGDPTGASDDTQAAIDATNTGRAVYFPKGTYNLDGFIANRNDITWFGDGMQLSVINITTPPPGYGIQLGGFARFSTHKLRIQGAGNYLINNSASSQFNRFSETWFGPAARGFDIGGDFFWADWTACIIRDCDVGIRVPTAQDANAWSFNGTTFFHFNPTGVGVGASVDLVGGDGISFNGCHVQNQGMKFNGSKGINIDGGYWECYDVPAIEATNAKISIEPGTYFPSGNRFQIDKTTADAMRGSSPRIFAQDSGGIELVDNGSAELAPILTNYLNVFIDPTCSTQEAVDNLQYTPTGVTGTEILNGSGNVQFTFTATNQRNGFQVTGNAISAFAKWRSLNGVNSLRLGNTTPGGQHQHDASVNSDWQYTYFHAVSNGSLPYIEWRADVVTTNVVEVDTLIIVDTYGHVTEARLAGTTPLLINARKLTVTGQAKAREFFTERVGPVNIGAAATATVKTFTSADEGTWMLQVDQGFLRTDQQHWCGVVVVGTNSDLNFSAAFSSALITVANTGFALDVTNTGGTAKDIYATLTKVG